MAVTTPSPNAAKRPVQRSKKQPDPLRVHPVQRRAVEQLETIEAAARKVLETKGRDRFTTSDVAALAEVSIGTVYRYFPDRIAILDRVWPDRRDDKLPRTTRAKKN
jgi:hypothetical protein